MRFSGYCGTACNKRVVDLSGSDSAIESSEEEYPPAPAGIAFQYLSEKRFREMLLRDIPDLVDSRDSKIIE